MKMTRSIVRGVTVDVQTKHEIPVAMQLTVDLRLDVTTDEVIEAVRALADAVGFDPRDRPLRTEPILDERDRLKGEKLVDPPSLSDLD